MSMVWVSYEHNKIGVVDTPVAVEIHVCKDTVLLLSGEAEFECMKPFREVSFSQMATPPLIEVFEALVELACHPPLEAFLDQCPQFLFVPPLLSP
mmetsp:Transcript_46581/g.79380  ORF Transcript_46581/g.79380 Transcript_46581/m.79380 type:complete len:95 (+) Transcript_46581:402-686(+)